MKGELFSISGPIVSVILALALSSMGASALAQESVEARLEKLGLTLPATPKPVANYVPAVRVGNLLFVAGQGPSREGKILYQGHVGKDLTIEEGYEAAKACALNILSIVKSEIGSLDKVERIVMLSGFVNSADDFAEQPKVLNGASDLMVELFGDNGKHARAAIGVNVLPFNIAVEVAAIVEVKED